MLLDTRLSYSRSFAYTEFDKICVSEVKLYIGEVIMPIKDDDLTSAFNLQDVDLEKLASNGWHDQGSATYHFGLPRRKNLWVKRITPSHQCGHVTIWLFVFLYLDKKAAIKKVETSVHQVFNDGSYEEMEVEFFPPDRETAAEEIRSILKSEATE